MSPAAQSTIARHANLWFSPWLFPYEKCHYRLSSNRTRPGAPGLGHHRRSEEHTSELQSRFDLVCRLLLEKKKRSGRSRKKTFIRNIEKWFSWTQAQIINS